LKLLTDALDVAAPGAQLVHLVQLVLNWYNLVAASAAGGVPFFD
jgi:hypothetical protein